MSKWISLGALLLGGIIIADIISNAHGTQTAFAGAKGLEVPAFNALLGKPS
jgi:hypothetical protein